MQPGRPGTGWDAATEESQPPPSEPNYRVGGGRAVPAPEKEQGFPFHLEILTHAEGLTTHTVKATVYWLGRPIARIFQPITYL